MKRFILCYDDENHYKNFWIDREFIGSTEDMETLLATIYGYGLEDNPHNAYDLFYIEINIGVDLDEEDFNTLHNYLAFPRLINKEVWQELIAENYVNAVKKIRELC